MSMKVTELKEELEARGESKTGNKAWLRRRLHAAIVRARLQEAVEESRESERIWRTADSLGYNQSSFQTVINDFKPL